ncbi:phage tail protein [Phreatobacter stygius]|uniref:Phage tail protein n=1 Tax=Phreatobacter stygius TaxID=1940610 RepID=A0A4D7B7J5_9HYPH|nr:phage tail protein [Phreatobacter stygius]QCI65626.1 hypothetical protein E8M01_16280 [Phreatobacter stygius]
MIFALLGDIRIGNAVWTGPTSAKETSKATLPEHKVARGKPVVQDMGDELDTKALEFFFDETFCEPQAELARLEMAFAARMPLPFVGGDGAFDGIRWIIEEMDVQTLKTTPFGRPVRFRISLKMKEVPMPSLLSFLGQVARGAATALTSTVASALNPLVRR